ESLPLPDTRSSLPAAQPQQAKLEIPAPAAQATPAVSTPNATPAVDENWVRYTIGKGDTLSSLFSKAGLSSQDVYSVTNASRHNKGLSRIYPGQEISFLIENNELKKLRLIRSKLLSTQIEKTENGYVSQIIERKPEIQHRYASGVINSSLFVDAEKAGLSNRMIMSLASIFGWDVDFALDIRQGDSFSVIYEERFLDGKMIGEGNIIAAQFTNQGRLVTALRFTDSNGTSSYYTPNGKSMRKAFLRTPVDFARISSRFNLKRKHPVLNRIRAHKGTDYAARTGTPIKASGDGKIIWRGTKGGFGRAVIIQHGSNITTLYAHMSKYRKGQRSGSRVKQGDIIGYVGQSGLASGPHLHYEFRLNGVHKNPMRVKFPNAAPIPKKERPAFKAVAATLMTQLESYRTTQVAVLQQ
ncbi:OapA family protein, partial [Pontibacterium sp.]|uniref:OapA family protein n=1 Tax=Pontibacterium sp. TaxID=2036026 RepID=UPI003565E88F